jgi:hypothetical protein
MLASAVVAWSLDDSIRGITGTGVSMVLATIAGGVAFILVKRFVSELRPGS